MKKIGIVTLYSVDNYGNRLQNYAMQTILQKKGFDVESVVFRQNTPLGICKDICKKVSMINFSLKNASNKKLLWKRYSRFEEFTNKKIPTKFYPTNMNKEDINKNYDFFVTGSDQVWNPIWHKLENGKLPFSLSQYFLTFAKKEQRVSISPSIGVSQIPKEYEEEFAKCLKGFSMLSVREDAGAKIIEELTGQKAIVLSDPTMILSKQEWLEIETTPAFMERSKQKPYLLTCFLGEISEQRKAEIAKIATVNKLEIINLLDAKNPEAFITNPGEFISLVNNSAIICTDSFHAIVFSMLFEKPFIAFERDENKNCEMMSRLQTLLNRFSMTDRMNDRINTENVMEIDYSQMPIILEQERKKFSEYVDKAFA